MSENESLGELVEEVEPIIRRMWPVIAANSPASRRWCKRRSLPI